MPRKLAATLENNAWRFRKRVMADYVPECMHRRSNDKAVVRHLHRRLRSARLAQEAEGASGSVIYSADVRHVRLGFAPLVSGLPCRRIRRDRWRGGVLYCV